MVGVCRLLIQSGSLYVWYGFWRRKDQARILVLFLTLPSCLQVLACVDITCGWTTQLKGAAPLSNCQKVFHCPCVLPLSLCLISDAWCNTCQTPAHTQKELCSCILWAVITRARLQPAVPRALVWVPRWRLIWVSHVGLTVSLDFILHVRNLAQAFCTAGLGRAYFVLQKRIKPSSLVLKKS